MIRLMFCWLNRITCVQLDTWWNGSNFRFFFFSDHKRFLIWNYTAEESKCFSFSFSLPFQLNRQFINNIWLCFVWAVWFFLRWCIGMFACFVCLLLSRAMCANVHKWEKKQMNANTIHVTQSVDFCLHWLFAARAVSKTELINIDVDIWWSTIYLLSASKRTDSAHKMCAKNLLAVHAAYRLYWLLSQQLCNQNVLLYCHMKIRNGNHNK